MGRYKEFKDIRQRVDVEFSNNLKKLHPGKSFREATSKLNSIVEEMLYGKKK